MSMTRKQNQNQARDLKHRVLTCLHKLSDRDTHSAAAIELEAIAKALSSETIPPFLSSIAATDSSDKSPVRKECLRLISILSENHGNLLSPYLSKLLSAVIRRLRDHDSAVRSACVTASASISLHVTKTPFSFIMKPFLEALFTEQEMNSQIGAALCLAAAIEAAPDPDVVSLRKQIPRFEKLLKSESFKAKAALLTLIGSVIAVGAASNQQVVRNLVPRLIEFVSSEDWAARKASAETLLRLGVAERETLSEFKASCLKTFEAKLFDKVKTVRETISQMLEAWKEIPDLSDDVSLPPESDSSSRENGSDTPGSRSSGTPNVGRRNLHKSKTNALGSSSAATEIGKKATPAIFRKLDHKKPSELKIEVPNSQDSSGDDLKCKNGKGDEEKEGFTKPETKRLLFGKSASGCRVVPCQDERSDSNVVMNESGDLCKNQKERDNDLSEIRKQLVQIENQQSNLLQVLQKFIGTCQSGMRSLETRVHGLELSLDEISYELAVSTGRIMSNRDSAAMCCKLPGAEFLSSKLWRRRSSTSQFPASGGTPFVASAHNKASPGFIVNPLAETNHYSQSQQGISHVPYNGVSRNLPMTRLRRMEQG
ncbi:PREDICTED: microtubule-associated protein TORTIFOLIA1-like [Ipomoea nil]|uniref:microtubule-associated protein TORTIFOLIA1-like n=1 Tax=Ipomoea nil TaxID=35883 RepID=UPI0009010A11|nr:PREDICTED: microtubule-associated protein TORTIFOLIA1-like [Ipomoea nil]XP_019197312.1 PREDICTED: microtubule-associated protein TORTIFOLIA1-like [Ipomoea nil]